MRTAADVQTRRVAAWLIVATLLTAGVLAQDVAGGRVSGMVYGPLLEPVPNAQVTVRTQGWDVVKTGKTDGSGEFFFTGLPGRLLYFCGSAPGLHTACEFAQPSFDANAPVRIDLRLFAAATVRGIVRSEAGKPIAGASVVAAFDAAWRILAQGEQHEESVTDAEGRFELKGVPLGDIAVRASAQGFLLGESAIYIEADAETVVVCKPGQGRELVVVVTGVPAERLPDIACALFASRPYPKPNMILPRRLVHGVFDERGEWVVRGLPKEVELSMIRLNAVGMRFLPQWHKVEAGKDGRVTFALDAITGPRPSPVDPDAEREPAPRRPEVPPEPLRPKKVENPTLRGVLRDEKGRPVGLVLLRLYCDRTGWRDVVTADDGTFALDAAYEAGDAVCAQLEHENLVLAPPRDTQRTSPGEPVVWFDYARGKGCDLVAVPACTVRGVLRTTSGEPVAGERIHCETEVAGMRGLRTFVGMGRTNDRGEFVISRLGQPEGPIWLVVTGLRGNAEAGPLTMKGKRELAGIKLKLEKPFEVTGSVVDARGKAVPGARVLLSRSEGRAAEPNEWGDVTLANAEGRFAFRGMKGGEYVLFVRVRGDEVAATSKPFQVGKQQTADKKLKVDR